MSKTLSIKTLLASSAIAFSLLTALGSAHAEQPTDQVTPPSAGTSRQIEVLPGAPSGEAQADTDTRADGNNAPAGANNAPGGAPSNTAANAPDGAVQDAALADAPPPNASQDGPPADNAPPADAAPGTSAPTTTATAPTQAEPQGIISDETKRANRQRYIERYEARQYQESRHKEYYEPRYKERYVEPRYKEHYVAPRYVEPRYVAPRRHVERDTYEYRYQAKPNQGYAPRREYYGSRY
jgi:hypothetical protein